MVTTRTPDQPDVLIADGTWQLDRTRSTLAFAVKTMWGLSTVNGHFERFGGDLTVSPAGVAGVLDIEATSLDTEHPKRDAHLRTADFFASDQYPRITFTVSDIRGLAGGAILVGDLAIRGATVPLKLPVDIEDSSDGSLRLHATTSMPRDQVGMSWNKLGMIRGDAQLTLDVQLVREV
jgi:polyisoprenoid-binding protein YceI